ncbi:apoptosis-associated speck-like protein containing a CARD [Anableps anableps]
MPRNIRLLLLDTLEDLSKENFDKFCFQLLDRREEPKVRRCRVEGKSRLEIADVLVSTFTEDGAGGVAVKLLRDIGCNQQAETLEMPPKTARMVLKDILDNLPREDFETFRSYLVGRKDGVKKIQVEDKSRLDVIEVMISVYTEKEVLKVAEELLREIRCTQDADDLVEEAKKAGLFCSADESCSDEEHFVDKHMDELIQRVTAVPPILDKLLKAKVIQSEAYDEIMAESTSQAKMRALYKGPLRAGRNAKDVFLQILEDQQRFLIDDLMKK